MQEADVDLHPGDVWGKAVLRVAGRGASRLGTMSIYGSGHLAMFLWHNIFVDILRR